MSALAGLISAVANLALAAGGKQSWTQAITSVLFAALGCVGLGGMRGMLGAVKGLSGLKGAIKSVGGLKGLVTGTITHGLAAIKSTFGTLKRLGTRFPVALTKLKNATRAKASHGGSGPWFPDSATPGGAVPQITPQSCVSASGEMLTRAWNKIDGTPIKTQEEILSMIGDNHVTNETLAKVALGDGWRGGGLFTDGVMQVLSRGPIAAELGVPRMGGAHNVLIEPLQNGEFLVRGPIGVGYTYLVDPAWISEYVYGAAWREWV